MSSIRICLFCLSILCFPSSGTLNSLNSTTTRLSPSLPLYSSQFSPGSPVLNTSFPIHHTPTPVLSSSMETRLPLLNNSQSVSDGNLLPSYSSMGYLDGGDGTNGYGGGGTLDSMTKTLNVYSKSVIETGNIAEHSLSSTSTHLTLQHTYTKTSVLDSVMENNTSTNFPDLAVDLTFSSDDERKSTIASYSSVDHTLSDSGTLVFPSDSNLLMATSAVFTSSKTTDIQLPSLQSSNDPMKLFESKSMITNTEMISFSTPVPLNISVTPTSIAVLSTEPTVALTSLLVVTRTLSSLEELSSTASLTQTNETDDFTVSPAVPDDVSTENPETITVSGIDDTTVQPSGIPYSMYTLKFEGNCTVLISDDDLQDTFKQKLKEMLATILKVNESQISLGSVLCGSVLINVTISNTQNTDTTSVLKSRVDSGNFNFSFVADNNTYAYSAESIQVLVEPPKVTSSIVPSTTKSTKEPGSGTPMPVPGKNNDENIRMIIIIVCAVGGGLLVLVILICICYYCRRKCSKASGSFDLGDTPSPHIKSEDFKLEKMPRSPGYYNEDGYVVKNEYSDPYIENKRSPDSGTFSLGENGTQNDNNQNEKSSNYDNIDTEDVSGRRLSREALVREQRSESPGYDNPSFSEDEILNTPEPATFSVVVEDSTPDEHKTGNQTEEPATFSIVSENQKSEPVTHSLETKTPQTEKEVVEEINPHTDLDIIHVVVTEEVKAEPVSDSEPHVDTQHSDQTDNSKHSSLSSLSSASYKVTASEEPLPPPPAFIMVDYEENEDENDAMGSYDLPHGDQAESAELTLPVDHITVNVPQVNEVISDSPADKDSSESSHSDNESKHSSISNHQSMETSETPAHSHKDTIPTISFPPPPDVGPETADQGSLTELDDHDAYDDEDALHHHDDDQKYPHDPYSSEEKSALDKDAESATLF